MGAVRMCGRAVLRRRVPATIAMALLVGVAGGAVLAAVAGARRTESAYPRLLDATRASDVTVIPGGFGARVAPRRLGRLPNVVAVFGVQSFSS